MLFIKVFYAECKTNGAFGFAYFVCFRGVIAVALGWFLDENCKIPQSVGNIAGVGNIVVNMFLGAGGAESGRFKYNY